VSHWIERAKSGDEAAIQALWGRYFAKLVRLARRKLAPARRRANDEEDVAISAFASFCRAAKEGRFPQLADRDDLWRLLATITARKVVDQKRRERAGKRGDGKERGESIFSDGASGRGQRSLADIVGRSPSPDFAAVLAEELQRLLRAAPDDLCRSVLLHKLEGCTNREIAGRVERAEVTVERCLRLIRKAWQREIEP
jgi:DNA-directed RNA polymerase specialized sigma24 family protein